MNGYVIEYGNAQKVFVEERLYIDALECLKSLGQRVLLAQWVDHVEDDGLQKLDDVSFGYIIEYETNDRQKEVKRVFAPAAELESITYSLCKEGYKPMLARWTNCILHPVGTEVYHG